MPERGALIPGMTEISESVSNEILDQVEQLLAEEREVRPQIWEACEAQARKTTSGLVKTGDISIKDLATERERYTRKYAVEQLVNYGLSEGMRTEDVIVLFVNVLGEEAYESFKNQTLPERAVIDDLRARVYLITQFQAEGQDSLDGDEKSVKLTPAEGSLGNL